jgi:signal transduction histidine kinase
MWRQISLRARLISILTGLMLISLVGGGVMTWYTFRIEGLFSDIIFKHLAAYETAEALETALVNQKGFVSYYLIDRDPDWLRQLGEYRQIFKTRLVEAQRSTEDPQLLNILNQIEKEYNGYVENKDQVINYYKADKLQEGARLHKQVKDVFFNILNLCEQYKTAHKNKIMETREITRYQAINLRYIAAAAVCFSFFLEIGLFFFLVNQILGPVQRLAMEAGGQQEGKQKEDEITSLHRSVQGLLEDVDTTRQELEKSREHLLQSEKFALVGKLAASMAHSIRNPFTSVKMRLFSLSRATELTDTQKDDIAVISDEIRHIDTIVQNFLEFSRPPRLQIQLISPSSVVDQALQLLVHRLNSYGVTIIQDRKDTLPNILIDPEQLKEVIVNIIVNACEAMERGGKIIIRETVGPIPGLGDMAIIRLSDNGPGIPESILDKIFQPFFTTKEEGTGLGLSIASRIIEEHHGRLEVESSKGIGTTFSILLPIEEARS